MRGLLLGVASICLAPAAWAQVGSGWGAYGPPERLQTRGCAGHTAEGGVQRFTLTCASTGGDNRAEQRIENDYSGGTNQFEGEVRVVSLGGMNVSLKQTFMPNNGAFLMIAVSGDGRLYTVGEGPEANLADGIIGRWVRLNTVHDVRAGTHEIYVDGVLKYVKRGGRQVAWHDKYGTYRLGSGRGPIVAEWRNVKYWRDGKGNGGVSPPPADGGAPDGRAADAGGPDPAPADAAPPAEPVPADAGAPDAATAPPGPNPGALDASAPDPGPAMPPTRPPGGCALGGSATSTPVLLLSLLTLLAARRRRR